MPGGYRLEVCPNNRSKCNGKKPCKGSKLEKGVLRQGTWVEILGHGAFKWRHWGCVTPEQIKNFQKDFEEAADLDGFDELPEHYQDKVAKAWTDGHVDPEDVPESAKEPTPFEDSEEDGEDGQPSSSPAKKKVTPKKRAKAVKDEAGETETKPKSRGKKAKKEESEELSEEAAPPPKKKRGAAAKKAVKDESSDESESEPEAPPPKKQRGGAKKAAKQEPASEEEEEEVKLKKIAGRQSAGEAADKPASKRGRKAKAVKDEEASD